MEKLEIKHIAPYLPYGLKYQGYYGGVSTMRDIKHIRDYNEQTDEYTPNIQVDGYTIEFIKPLLHPLSDLYKEIDGKVGIVELAKIHDPDFDDTEDVTVTPLTGWSTMGHVDYWNNDGIECRFGWFNSFQAGYINPTRHRFVSNQLDLYTYLFQHHYDVYSLIDKGLAIDLNSISHE